MIALQTNASQQSFAVDPNMPVSWCLTETKLGCGTMLCGVSEEIRQS